MQQELAATLREQKRVFTEACTESPALSAELLLARALGLERHQLLRLLLMEPGRTLSAAEAGLFRSYAARRLQGEPVAYITGSREFYGREFAVTRDTLIPRPETELIVDQALKLFGSDQPGGVHDNNTGKHGEKRFADFGTGSGCLAVTLALELNRLPGTDPDGAGDAGGRPGASPRLDVLDSGVTINSLPAWQGLALDISPAALQVAAANANRLGAAHCLRFAEADFTAPLGGLLARNSLDLLVSNPPYVSEAEYRALAVEVRGYEPKTALVPAADVPLPSGSELLPRLCSIALELLKPGGVLLMEIGHGQGAFMRELLAAQSLTPPAGSSAEHEPPSQPASSVSPAAGWSQWEVLRDLAGLDRTVFARKG